jgi:serine/threonine protein kinase
VFARKILFIPWVGDSESQAELRAIETLSADGGHRNIVRVLNFGRLQQSPCYHIDMELCQLNLHRWIYPTSLPPPNTARPDTLPVFNRNASSSERCQQIRKIMIEITSGVEFIHAKKQVHRDLKPANSIYIVLTLLICSSSLFCTGSNMENCGFRVHFRGHVEHVQNQH